MKYHSHVNAEKEWTEGLVGFFVKVKGLLLIALKTVLGAGVSFWLKYWTVGIIFIVVGVSAGLSFWTIRQFWLCRIHTDQRLRDFMYDIRRRVADVLDKRSSTQFDTLHDYVVNGIAAYYREMLNDKHINCAIRLAEIEENESVVYKTRARSSGMDTTRSSRSSPIPENKGLALELRSKDCQGFVVVDDVQEVAKDETKNWHKSDTDPLPDVRSFMAVGINKASAESIQHLDMLGILYVTSDKRNRFAPRHVLPLSSLADLLGMVYPLVMSSLQKSALEAAIDGPGRDK